MWPSGREPGSAQPADRGRSRLGDSAARALRSQRAALAALGEATTDTGSRRECDATVRRAKLRRLYPRLARTGGTATASITDDGAAAERPRCAWAAADAAEWTDLRWSEQSSGPVYRDAASRLPAATAGGAGTEQLYVVRCDGSPTSFRWAAQEASIDPQVVIDAAFSSAQAQIPRPAVDISPSPAAGGIVNIGMWLAVDDPGQVNAFASVGPVWASVTARFTGVTWDMGNGDVITCDGLGTPYVPGSDTVEQGPCGYTYARASIESAPYHGRRVRALGRAPHHVDRPRRGAGPDRDDRHVRLRRRRDPDRRRGLTRPGLLCQEMRRQASYFLTQSQIRL